MQRTRLLLTIALWLGAASLAAYLLLKQNNGANLRLELNDFENMSEAEITAQAVAISTSTVLIEPRFTGRDADGRTWEVIAKTASRSGEVGNDYVNIQDVTATLTVNDDGPLTLTAQEGTYAKAEDKLALQGEVVATGLGLTVKSPHVEAGLSERRVIAQGPVTVSGDIGGWHTTLHGTRLTLTHPPEGQHLALAGRVTGRFYPTNQTETR